MNFSLRLTILQSSLKSDQFYMQTDEEEEYLAGKRLTESL